MAPPDSQTVKAATDDLRDESTTWDNSSKTLGELVVKAESLRMTGLQAGLFQIIVNEYDQLVTHVAGRAREGQQAMTAVATTLRSAADVYDQEDVAGEHRLKNLY